MHDELMLDELMLKLLESFSGKTLISLSAKVTGISKRTLSKGVPKRESTLTRAKNKMMKDARISRQNQEWKDNEIDNYWFKDVDTPDRFMPFSNLVRQFGCPDRFDYQNTLNVANSLDTLNSKLIKCREDDDVPVFINTLKEEKVLESFEHWFCFAKENEWLLSMQKATQEAKNWSDCQPLIRYAALMAYFQLMACWDIEFLSTYLTNMDEKAGMEPRPIVELLMPTLNPDIQKSRRSLGDLTQIPLKCLLNLCDCLSYYFQKGTWSDRPAPVKILAPILNPVFESKEDKEVTEQPLKNIRSGRRNLSLNEFNEVWRSMICRNGKADEHDFAERPPYPLYVAAQIITLLFIKYGVKAKNKKIEKIVIPAPELYRYWWNIYYEELKAKGVTFGDISWPDYLQEP